MHPRPNRATPDEPVEGSRAVRRIIQANIDRFKALLQDETDPTKRAMLNRLLAEEEAKLENRTKPEQKLA
jgi:hypothetical protein